MGIKKLSENIYEVEKEEDMNVPGVIFASPLLIESIKNDGKTIEQVKNVASLPGIVEKSIAMPDAHQGYGFSIGGVAAFDLDKGIISPGGIGYDIGCGVRVVQTDIKKEEFLEKRKEILNQLFRDIPSGVGNTGELKLEDNDLDEVLISGAKWALNNNYATQDDLDRTEDSGCLDGGDPKKISQRAKARGRSQIGTLGSGNHFLEIQEVETIYDKKTAQLFGLHETGQIVVMIHTGSRGLGHQTASDYLQKMEKEYGFAHLPDRELACAPIKSVLGQDYFSAMKCAANFAFVNRQVIAHRVKKSFQKIFPKVKISQVYDVAHNIAKIETHITKQGNCPLCVHRKGSTRSFGPGRKEIPECYRNVGQPVIIPGSMGSFSYILVGTEKAEKLSWGSTAHGAGRVHSRSYALKNLKREDVEKELAFNNVAIKARSNRGLIEEAPEVYKDVNEVAKTSHELGIGNLVVRLKPLAVIKG